MVLSFANASGRRPSTPAIKLTHFSAWHNPWGSIRHLVGYKALRWKGMESDPQAMLVICGQPDSTLTEPQMHEDLTEEEMRRALFGGDEQVTKGIVPPVQESLSDIVIAQSARAAEKKKIAKALTPRLRVTLRVGNEFEGDTHEMVHEADTLSTLLAEQEAVKTARKKFRFVEVVSIKSM